ncbi:hypothetical protein AVEN_88682-1 [Araneus ventricosus]|uniref:Uncharacterized protein n=1 Tax=Araneus ventricosus TaxID=182803 RepID=A0A4Y2MGH9_ARAVE|nr:hypothetical protein AVEN_88682-1 [Araneus ventricosus]
MYLMIFSAAEFRMTLEKELLAFLGSVECAITSTNEEKTWQKNNTGYVLERVHVYLPNRQGAVLAPSSETAPSLVKELNFIPTTLSDHQIKLLKPCSHDLWIGCSRSYLVISCYSGSVDSHHSHDKYTLVGRIYTPLTVRRLAGLLMPEHLPIFHSNGRATPTPLEQQRAFAFPRRQARCASDNEP